MGTSGLSVSGAGGIWGLPGRACDRALKLPGGRPAVLCFMRISCSQIVGDSKVLLLCGLYLLIFTVIVIKAEI